MTAVARCDEANEQIGKTLSAMSNGGATMYDAYARADDAASACQSASMALNGVSSPDGVSDDAGAEFSKALDACRDGYLLRQTSLDTVKSIFDGDLRPSLIAEYRKQAGAAQGGVRMRRRLYVRRNEGGGGSSEAGGKGIGAGMARDIEAVSVSVDRNFARFGSKSYAINKINSVEVRKRYPHTHLGKSLLGLLTFFCVVSAIGGREAGPGCWPQYAPPAPTGSGAAAKSLNISCSS